MAKGVWIVAEQRGGALRKVSFEIASAARKLADELGEEVSAVLVGSGVEGLATELAKYGVDKVYVADDAIYADYTTDAYSAAVAKVVKENDPSILLLGSSVQGKDLSASLVGKLATFCCFFISFHPLPRHWGEDGSIFLQAVLHDVIHDRGISQG